MEVDCLIDKAVLIADEEPFPTASAISAEKSTLGDPVEPPHEVGELTLSQPIDRPLKDLVRDLVFAVPFCLNQLPKPRQIVTLENVSNDVHDRPIVQLHVPLEVTGIERDGFDRSHRIPKARRVFEHAALICRENKGGQDVANVDLKWAADRLLMDIVVAPPIARVGERFIS